MKKILFTTGYVAAITFIIIQGYIMIHKPLNVPEYKSGDCIRKVFTINEFSPEIYDSRMLKIVRVGDKSYLVDRYDVTPDGIKYVDRRVKSFYSLSKINKSLNLVNCQIGEKLNE